MHLTTMTKRAIAVIASLFMVLAATIVAAPSSQARPPCTHGSNATASKFGGDYKATFAHHGETLKVEDHVTDGDAAVAYVEVYRFAGCINNGQSPVFESTPIDKDRFVMSTGLKTYNLGTPDGTGDIPEGWRVRIRVCRGYASLPGDNCSAWKVGIS